MSAEIKKWDYSELLSVEFLEYKYSQPKYRVSAKIFEPGVKFSGSSKKGLVFVLDGACKIETSECSFFVKKEHYFEQPSGAYNLTVTSSSHLSIVNVWDLERIIEKNT